MNQKLVDRELWDRLLDSSRSRWTRKDSALWDRFIELLYDSELYPNTPPTPRRIKKWLKLKIPAHPDVCITRGGPLWGEELHSLKSGDIDNIVKELRREIGK